ncbi:MAG: hypothetical protein K5872_23000 [Rhizobiaceae bacterium]|nr:hypothetical protein [Rhizobiaceae bacterium]MCV0409088.1 hypothetical protein [Rhizobiaceae bacterium]
MPAARSIVRPLIAALVIALVIIVSFLGVKRGEGELEPVVAEMPEGDG